MRPCSNIQGLAIFAGGHIFKFPELAVKISEGIVTAMVGDVDDTFIFLSQ